MSIFAFSASIHSVEKWPQASTQQFRGLSFSYGCFQGNKTLWLPKLNVLWNPDLRGLSRPWLLTSPLFSNCFLLWHIWHCFLLLCLSCLLISATSLMFFLILSINILSQKDLIYMLVLIVIHLQIMIWIHKPCFVICIKCLLKWINNYPLQSLIAYKFQAYKTLP